MYHGSVINNWKVEHYIAYLYLSIADSDNETTDEELALVTKKLKKLFDEYYQGAHLNHVVVMQEVLAEIKNHTDQEKTEIINNLNKKFPLEEFQKMDIISDLTDVIESDDSVSSSEHYMLSFLRAVMSKN
ncbi:MAG: hypothetical protein NW207_10815 [Cytophagales bacterium]|nr:hypothetical protein [Cytophagales bacterium]